MHATSLHAEDAQPIADATGHLGCGHTLLQVIEQLLQKPDLSVSVSSRCLGLASAVVGFNWLFEDLGEQLDGALPPRLGHGIERSVFLIRGIQDVQRCRHRVNLFRTHGV